MTGLYHDIGNKKVYVKTSQAREGLEKIQQMIQRDDNESIPKKSISLHGYFEFSVRQLEAMYRDDAVPSIVSPYLPPKPTFDLEDRIESLPLPPFPNPADSMNLLAKTISQLIACHRDTNRT